MTACRTAFAFIFSLCLASAARKSPDIAWQPLETGLDLGRIEFPVDSTGVTSTIRVLRIDPRKFELTLLNASAPQQGRSWSARSWCERENLVAAINASMYQTDYRTSVSLMKTADHTNNAYVSKDKSILAFDPVADKTAPVRLIDRECDDFSIVKKMYRTMVQSIRMISCTGRNVWGAHQPKWSIAAIGIDRSGNVLFTHCTQPLSVYQFSKYLQGSSLGIERAMYAEGGSEAQLFINSPKGKFEFIGQYTGGGMPSGASALPNVVGIRRR